MGYIQEGLVVLSEMFVDNAQIHGHPDAVLQLHTINFKNCLF